MKYLYYIIENGTTTDKQGLKDGVFIVKIPTSFPLNFKNGDGPYNSLRALKRISPILKSLKNTNPRRAQKIVLEKNIILSNKLIGIPRGTNFKPQVMDILMHSTIGRVQNKKVTGVHFYDPEKVRILEILKINDETKVFLARFEFFDLKTNKWLEKRTSSTFFPKDWNLATLLMECKFAFDNADINNLNDGKVKSKTASNIIVEMVIVNGKIKTLYPLI